jgi:hypothetical protein
MNETQDLMSHSGGNVVNDRGPFEVEPQESMLEPEQAYEIGSDEDRPQAEEPMSEEIDDTISNDNVRGVSINPLSSGYMVKVGCQSVAVESTERLIDMLNKYLTDPREFERKWYSKDVRNRLENIL